MNKFKVSRRTVELFTESASGRATASKAISEGPGLPQIKAIKAYAKEFRVSEFIAFGVFAALCELVDEKLRSSKDGISAVLLEMLNSGGREVESREIATYVLANAARYGQPITYDDVGEGDSFGRYKTTFMTR